MSNDEIDNKKISSNLNSIKLKKPSDQKSTNLNKNKDSSLILKEYSTPNPLKNEKSLFEMEMRKTIHTKHVSMMNNKVYNNFDVSNKTANKRSLVNNLKIIQENMNNVYNPSNKLHLEPLKLNKSRNEYINRKMSHNQEKYQKIVEDINPHNVNKLILKPIDIKESNRKNKNYKQNNPNIIFTNTSKISDINSNRENLNNLNHGKIDNDSFQIIKIGNKGIHNSNSSSNLFSQQNTNLENKIFDFNDNLTAKNFSNNNSKNSENFNNNLRNVYQYLKKENIGGVMNRKNSNLNVTAFDVDKQSPDCEKKIFDKFSKTSNFEYNIIENLDATNLKTDISLIEENLKMGKGELLKKLKSLYDDFNNSNKVFKTNNSCSINNKSYYHNTSVIEREKNNHTRIDTIFENYEVRLDEMVILSSNKSKRKMGILSKVVHTGSLNIYVVRDLPIIDKYFRIELREFISKWRRDLNDNKHLINIYGDNLKNGEKNYSIIYEYCQNGSLSSLIKAINTVPENFIKWISFQILTALEIYHKKTGQCYNCLTPYNILFDKNFQIKNFNNNKGNLNNIYNETINSIHKNDVNENFKQDFRECFFNETKMRQKLKKDWIQVSNKHQQEIDVDFIDNSINVLQDSKYYLNSSNILPNLDMYNYNTIYDKLPVINNNENFYKSQINLELNYNDNYDLKGNFANKNISQMNFMESEKNFYSKDKRLTQKLNFSSIYRYNLKSDNDLIEKIKNRDRENFLNNNSNIKNVYKKNNHSNNNFNETLFNPKINTRINNNTLYLKNGNNLNENEITYINLNNNNSAGFKFNSSGENNYYQVNLLNIKLDLYDFGVLLLYCLLGNFDIFNLSAYECKHINSDDCCCLLHCFYITESKSNSKIKLSDYFKKLNFSFNLEKFICSLTNYKLDKDLNFEYLKDHPWFSDIKSIYTTNNLKCISDIKNEQHSKIRKKIFNYVSKNILIEYDEFFGVANDINNKGSFVNNSSIEKKYEKFFQIFEKVFPKSLNYLKLFNINNYSQITNEKNNLEIIAKEMNIDKDYLDSKLNLIINNYFQSENYLNNIDNN